MIPGKVVELVEKYLVTLLKFYILNLKILFFLP